MIEISTSKMSTRKKVLIDGQEFTIRKLGAGEELDLSQISRELFTLLDELDPKKGFTEESAKKYDELKKKSLDIYIATFDDGGDQSKSKELIYRLNDDERNEIYSQAFPKTLDESTEKTS